MRLLAIDTVTEMCSVALRVGDEQIQAQRLVKQTHTDVILSMVSECLADGGLELSSLDAIAFSRGPGSFTGLRVCAGVTQGLALAANLPVIPVSSLAALAQGAWRQDRAGHILGCMDARRGEVYWACYTAGGSVVSPLGPEAVTNPVDVVAPEVNQWFGVGTGFASYYNELSDHARVNLIAVQAERFPLARDMLPLAQNAWEKGEYGDAGTAIPVYLRDNVATPQS